MDSDRQRRALELFETALSIAPDRRTAWLDEACAGDAELRDALEELRANAGSSFLHPEAAQDIRDLVGDAWPGGAPGAEPAGAPRSPTLSPVEDSPRTPSSIELGRFTPGTVLQERYRITGLLGRGGMGEVYRADDLTLGQTVALKFLNEGLAQDPELRKILLDEVRLAREVSHPSVCRVFDVGQVDGQLFLSMEFIDGEDLSSLLRRVGRLPDEKALEIARQLCAGLAAVHERGLIHRDLKPGNVMLDGRGKVRLTDFGLAAVLGEGDGPGGLVGTPAYMAPELFEGESPSVRSDVYALGLVLYEVITGRRAFEAKDLAGLAAAHREGAARPPSSCVPGVDPRVDEVLGRCLEKEPHLRPASALAVSAALPGGDPVAEALARGDTPSPEAVAASGGAGGLRPWAVFAWLALAAAAFLALCWAAPRVRLTGSVPLDLRPEVLEHKAREMLDGPLRYTETIDGWNWGQTYTAGGFVWRGSYDRWLLAAERTGGKVGPPAGENPPPYTYWYRASRERIYSDDPLQYVRAGNPMPGRRREAYLELKPSGLLHAFLLYRGYWEDPREGGVFEDGEWVPPISPDPSSVDAAAILRLAGFDPEAMDSVQARYHPQAPSDFRLAWVGPSPGSLGDDPLTTRVELAFMNGLPASLMTFDPQPDAELLEERPGTAAERVVTWLRRNVGGGMTMALLAAGLVVMLHNLRHRRGDRKGATRLAWFLVAVTLSRWLFATNYVGSPGAEFERFGRALGYALFSGGMGWMLYMGIEPQMRRVWPSLLVGWTRLLEGRFRDPMVARDLLAGLALGLVLASINPLAALASAALGAPLPRLAGADIDDLASNWAALDEVLKLLPNAPLNGLLGALMFTLMRLLVRRQWVVLVALYPIAVLGFPVEGIYGSVFTELGVSALSCIVFALALLRFGVLAASVTLSLMTLAQDTHLTLDLSAWHATPTVLLLVMCLALGAFAAYHALDTRSAT